MLFPEEDAPLLKAWIVKRIENTSDADSDVLADYVIALLKHDGDKESVRKLCEQEIPDFLTEDSTAFLDDVFRVIEYKSYVPGAPPPPPKTDPSSQLAGSIPAPGNSRKRAHDDEVMEDANGPSYGGERAYKQPRRGGGRGGYGGNMGLPPGMPPFDANNPMEAFMRMQSMGMGMMDQFGNQGKPKRKGRCRDFDTKGFCSRGSTCMYDHGNEAPWTPPFAQGEYNPEDAMKNMAMLNQMMGHNGRQDRNGRGRGRNDRRGKGRKGGNRSGISAEGPVHDRTKTSIVIENIPQDNFTEEQVREFFSQFGQVEEVTLRDKKKLAIIKFDTWDSANAAYQSPKVIFDNRFVKVFWFRDEAESRKAEEPEMDPEEFQRRQEEAQKQYQEREAKRSELEQQRQQLEKQQQELLAKHREEMERLRAKMGEPTTSSAANSNGNNNGNGSGNGEDGNSTNMLRAKLAELEQEAMILGITPDEAEGGETSEFPGRGGYRGRGSRGYRGRGRGGYAAPRGRGSFRGTGRHAAYAQYSIDNRPRTVNIAGADFTASDKDEALRHFLLNTGEFTSLDASPDTTQVSFPDRKTAEKFYYSLHGKDLPGVEGKLELSWANNPVVAEKPAGGSGAVVIDASASSGDKDVDGAGDAMAGMDADADTADKDLAHAHGHHDAAAGGSGSAQRREVDMDYEMPDDEWA